MKSWPMFVITLGTLGVATYPISNKLITLLMGLTFIFLGIILLIRGSKK